MKIGSPLQIIVLSATALGFQFDARAQDNLANLNDWTAGTQYGSSPNSGIIISDSASAIFFGSYSANVFSGPDHIIPILTGTLDTTPGTTYKISYSLEHDGRFIFCDGTFSFGSFNYGFNLPFTGQPSGTPEAFDFLVTANASSTPMSFTWPAIDNGDAAFLSHFSVTAVPEVIPVPEVSTAGLLGLGGCAWLLAPFVRRSSGKRKSENQRIDAEGIGQTTED
jgi:hypothetical protein